ncbi:MAG: BamA/TamA family outer membrane protein [Gracilimonas sp.]
MIRLTLLLGFFCLKANLAYSQDEFETTRVWNIKIEGNKTYEGIIIKNIISYEPPSAFKKLQFWRKPGMVLNENDLKRDVIRIERFYQRRGFNEVFVSYRIEDNSKEWRKTVVFEIVENQPIRISDVQFVLNSPKQDSTLILNDERFAAIQKRLPYRPGQRYETVNQSEVIGNLVGALRNLGYPYAESTVETEIDTTSKTADVVLISNPGPRARFDSLLVEGEDNLDAKYIIRETGIEKNELFSETKLRNAQREIFNHHMLRFALISIPDQPKDSLINIRIRVKESPLRTVQLRFGVGNLTRFEGLSDIYKLFRGQASWTHRSVRNRGERLRISAEASAIEQRFSTDYLFPYLYNTKSSLIISPFVEHNLEPSYEIFRGGITNSFIYQYSSNLTGTISHEFTLNNEFTTSSQESLPDSVQDYNVSSFNLNMYYSKGLRGGKQGWSMQPFWELSGLFGESTFSFQKTGIDVRKFTSLTDNIVFAKRINFSGIYYAKQDSLPSDIRIYNGGTNSVRGWNRRELGPKRPILDEDDQFDRFVPVGGNATISFNAEFRFQLNGLIKGFGVATFLDGGQVWRNFMDIGTTPIQYGLGGGLRYQSPIGPIRVDIAYKINPTDEDLWIYQGQNYGSAWDKWGIHFSIGQAF